MKTRPVPMLDGAGKHSLVLARPFILPHCHAAGKWTLPVRDSDKVYKTKVNYLEIVFI